MAKTLLTVILLLASMCSFAQGTMCSTFKNIPENQPLAVYWYWIAGNISKDGVIKDLDAMKKAGITRVQIGMIGEGQGVPKGDVELWTEEWWDILHAMFKHAGELDIEVGLFNCPGWSQSGGPWVKPEQSMRYLACSKDTVSGGRTVNIALPQIDAEQQRVKVLAMPLKAVNQTIVRGLVITPRPQQSAFDGEVFVKEPTGERVIKRFHVDRSNDALNVGFVPYAKALVSIPDAQRDNCFVRFTDENAVEKAEFVSQPVVDSWAEKSLSKMWPTPHPMWDAYMWQNTRENGRREGTISSDEIIDVTNNVTEEGILKWKAPEGDWVIMQTAMVPTRVVNSPAPAEATGYEADKMSREHIRDHFDKYLGEILRRIPAEDRTTFKIVVEDSYETGGQNWTDNMIADFRNAYGYDPVPFMPVLDGIVVNSEDESDRFLWDLRRLIADEVAYNYVGGLRDISHEHGLTTWLECYGHWGFPGEFLQYGGQSDEIGGEFWTLGDLGDIENRLASSCGHIYGKNRVWAESFTSGFPSFTFHPAMLKTRGDRFFTEGINSTLYHIYVQQPDDRKPGINAWFGTEFNRNNTWFSQFDVFNQYMKRCNYMLQQGRYVADVAYFIGEDAPKMMGTLTPELPHGYSFDYVNAEVLMDSWVENQELCLKSGMRYSVLVLPPQTTMRPALARKIRSLSEEGLAIVGPRPERSPSLAGYPDADKEVKTLGEGIATQESLVDALASLGVKPDFVADNTNEPLLFIHRTTDEGEVYFISNQSDREVDYTGQFRVSGKHPQLWNPLTAEVRPLPEYTSTGELTEVPLMLHPQESAFIVFSDNKMSTTATENFPKEELVCEVDGEWTVDFQEERGLKDTHQTMVQLADWTENDNPEIRYFSGTAVYKNSFRLKKLPKGELRINLGKVGCMAKVKINGQYVGGVWTSPYLLNITSAVRKGMNDVEIEVVNCWRNRIIGELDAIPEADRFTYWTSNSQDKNSDLQPSGLLGPVQIIR